MVLIWGWGEEGQLGNIAEKNSVVPAAVSIPRLVHVDGAVKGGVKSEGKVVGFGLGLSHTVVLLENVRVASGDYLKDEPMKVTKEVREEAVVEEKKDDGTARKRQKEFAQRMMEQTRQAQIELEAREEMILRSQQAMKKRRESEKGTLARFEERKAGLKKKEEVVVMRMSPVEVLVEKKKEVQEVPVAEDENDDEEEEELAGGLVLEEFESGSGSDEGSGSSRKENLSARVVQMQERPKSPNNVQFTQKVNYDQIYYHPDQPVEKCFVANAARRAMMRSIQRRKAEAERKRQGKGQKAVVAAAASGGGGRRRGSILRQSSYGTGVDNK